MSEERDNQHKTGRRQFMKRIALATGAAAVSGCTPEKIEIPRQPPVPNVPKMSPSLPDGLNPAHFIVHNLAPLALESRRSEMGQALITPLSRFFVRNNLPRPDASIIEKADHWLLQVKGVKEVGQISLAKLRGLGLETETSVIQCSGNGREFFDHGASGSQWSTGAAGCAMWTGVRVSRVLEYFGGPLPEAKFLTATGGETLPDGVDRDTVVVERSIPLGKGMSDALLAWEMNGEPIPISHGGPLRLIVPGYFGCNNIKYVKTLSATKSESSAKIQASGYRLRALGEKGHPGLPSMWRMPVKSWVNGPGADSKPVLGESVVFYGVAFSGERGIKGVEVSMDQGITWTEAKLEGPDLGPNAWRIFKFATTLSFGSHTIVSRATDREGDVQPEQRKENERGYGHNGWKDHALTVEVVSQLPPPAVSPSKTSALNAESDRASRVELSTEGERGRKIYIEQSQPSCGVCHTLENAGSKGVVGPNLNQLKPTAAQIEAAVSHGVGAMPGYSSTLKPDEIKDLAKYIVESTR